MRSLVISVRLHDDRWHGTGEWPPSPGRLFQALVAGLGARGPLSAGSRRALEWLERQPHPMIAVPPCVAGRGFTNFVPNNDLDAVGGDPRRVGEIRAGKTIRPRLLEAEPEFRFAWILNTSTDHAGAQAVCEIAQWVYQFGRGVDMAYARADVLSQDEAEAHLADYSGQVWRPSDEAAGGGVALRCPAPGTLQSLIDRHADRRKRIVGGVFRKPREARFRLVGYDCPPLRLLLELRPADGERRFQPWPLAGAAGLTTAVRDAAAGRLAAAGVAPALVERYVIGRGANGADKGRRVRIIPLPSVGHAHADPSIRRILVERPPDCPIPVRALDLALSNLDLARYDPATGGARSPALPVLAPAQDIGMLGHYGIGGERMVRVWHSVTPVALPVARERGRMSGALRAESEARASHAVRQALRHAGVATRAESIRVQREPLFSRGARAETFAATVRFPAERLWHVEVAFVAPVAGPLVIGDGRYCGLGVMAPSPREAQHRDVLILPIGDGSRPAVGHHDGVVGALRRALMSRAADDDGRIPTLFSGHESGPGPARSGQHRHVFLFADDADSDGFLDRVIVAAPWRIDRTLSPGANDRALFARVVTELRIVRAGAAGILRLDPARQPRADDPLFSSSPTWDSRTHYRVTRHPSHSDDPNTVAMLDLAAECARRGLPRPHVEIKQLHIGPRGGIRAEARLGFTVSVAGPILLGRDAHRGGGLFARRYRAGKKQT